MSLVSQSGLCAAGVVLCALVFLPTTAQADIQTIRSANNAVWGSAGAALLNYKESVSPLPNSQHGWIPSVGAGASYMGCNNLYLAVEGSVSFGNDHYSGAYLNNPDVPLEATTRETITTVDGKVGKGFALGHNVMITPYADLGFRYWTRELSGWQTEDYDNFEALAGALLQFSPTDHLVLSAYGSGGGTFGAQMKTDGDTFDLGSAGAFKAGGKIGYNLTQRTELFTSLDFDHLRYVKSDAVNGTYEPSSGTNNTAWRVGLSYHFN